MKCPLTLLASVATLLVHTSAHAAIPTGDGLYDAFANLVESKTPRLVVPGLETSGLYYCPAVIDDGSLEALESRFASDPRYWELRVWTMEVRSEFPALTSADEPNTLDSYRQRMTLLERAARCGKASPYAMYRLASLKSKFRQANINASPSADGTNDGSSSAQSQLARSAMIRLIQEDEAAYLADLDTIASSWPNEAWPQYWKAEFYFEIGEHELAANCLNLGNAARDCRYPCYYPESFIRQRLWDGQPCGSKWIAGAVLSGWQISTDWTRWKSSAKDVVVALSLGGGSETANALKDFGCRVACAPGSTSVDCIAGLLIPSILAGGMLDLGAGDLTQEQVDTLLHVRDLARQPRDGFSDLDSKYGVFSFLESGSAPQHSESFDQDHSLDYDNLELGVRALVKSTCPRQRCMDSADLTIAEFESIRSSEEISSQLRMIDFATLAWPEAWGSP